MKTCNVTQHISFRHFFETDLKDINKRRARIIPDKLAEGLLVAASCGYTYTILYDGYPVAVVGGHMLWQGVAQIWAITSDDIRGKAGLTYTKIALELLHQLAEKFNLHRYHCIVDSLERENIRWLITLGFRYESTMIKATSVKTDLFIYARLEDEYGRPRRPSTRLRKHVADLLNLVDRR